MQTKFQQTYKEFANLVLGNQLRDMTATSVCNSLANLYTMDEHSNTFRYSKLSGILTLDLDRPLKTRFFRMYSMDSFELLFECQLYYGFEEQFMRLCRNYRPISDNLWCFDFLQGIILFEFTNMGQGQKMADAVKQHSKKMKQYKELMEQRRLQEQKKKKDGTWIGKFKNLFNREEKVVHEQTKILSVKKQNSISFDSATGKFTNIPPQFVEQLAKLGLTKKDLENKETAKIVMEEILVFQAIKQAEADPSSTALRETIKVMKLDYLPPEPPKLTGIPPPPNIGLLPPPTMPKPPTLPGRGDLLKEIEKGNFKLKPVEVNKKDGGLTVDLSTMDKDDRQDLSAHIKAALKKRSQALMRDQEDSD